MSLNRYYSSTLTRKGQATIPIELREKLGLAEGDRLVWREVDGVLTVVSARNHVERTAGMLQPYLDPTATSPSIDEMEDAISSTVLEKYQTVDQRG